MNGLQTGGAGFDRQGELEEGSIWELFGKLPALGNFLLNDTSNHQMNF
jgi:hypothetical protein